MKQRTIILIALLTMLVSLPAGATQHRPDRNENSIWVGTYGSLHSWRPVARNQLVVFASPSRAYLVTLWPNATRLRFANAIGITNTAGRITKFDRVIVDGRRVPIESIQRIDKQQARAMRYQRG